MTIFLIGFMGSGKSTIGRLLAEQLNYSFIDSDSWIEEKAQLSISEIFADFGEDYFRKLEQEFILQFETDNTVIACGGGLPCYNNLMHEIKQKGIVIYLNCSAELLVNRLKNETHQRPLIAGLSDGDLKNDIERRMNSRISVYEKSPITVFPEGLSVEETVSKIKEEISKSGY